jgi:hypothetical protein
MTKTRGDLEAFQFATLLDLASRMRWELHGYHETYDERDLKTARLLNEFDVFCQRNNLKAGKQSKSTDHS